MDLRHEPCAVRVHRDRALLDRVLPNLLENAIRYNTPLGARPTGIMPAALREVAGR